MDFELSDEQGEFQRAAHDLLVAFFAPLGESERDESRSVDDKAWDAITNQGWLGVLVPEELGGLGLTWVEACVVLEQVGRFVAPIPVAPSLLAIEAAVEAGEPAAVEALLDGESCAFVVSTERYALDVEHTREGWLVTGDGAPALHLPEAGHVLCTARLEGAVGLFLVAVGDCVRVEELPCADPTRSLGRATFRRAPARRLGGPEEVARLIDRASLVASADMLGAARQALDLATAYAKDRVQFGQPIGAFQAVKHRLADMHVDVEAMHSVTFWAAWCLSNEHAEERVAAATARWCTRECAPRVMAGALQVHGGIGFTWEHEMHRYMKRVTLDALPIGGRTPCEPDLSRLLVEAYRAGEGVI